MPDRSRVESGISGLEPDLGLKRQENSVGAAVTMPGLQGPLVKPSRKSEAANRPQ